MANQRPIKIQRALLSVSDKSGLVGLAKHLSAHGVEILSTGGTANTLRESGIAVVDVAQYTNSPEILGGRVKTLHPAIHGGILARRDKHADKTALAANKINPIDLIVVNLYPFEHSVASGKDTADCIENIDIGGPAMIRSAAKNHEWTAVVTDPKDYPAIIEELNSSQGAISFATRQKLAGVAFARTSAYDSAISHWFNGELKDSMPEKLTISAELKEALRYGENPHQEAAFYITGEPRKGVATAKQAQGKSLSYNNLNDTDAAFELVAEFDRPAASIIKHANPCGVALGLNPKEAYTRALKCDPTSAYGGVIAFNRKIDGSAAEAVTSLFAEVVIAPAADTQAMEIFAQRKNLRLLLTGSMPDAAQGSLQFRSVAGGLLVQARDQANTDETKLELVTKRAPNEEEITNLLFAFKVSKHVKSNAIVYVKDQATVGIGAGQMSRVDSSRIAAWKARTNPEAGTTPANLVVASDAFFPFADGLLAAIEAGATAVIQPGGSIRDEEVIAAADAHNIAMVFTGLRHFRH